MEDMEVFKPLVWMGFFAAFVLWRIFMISMPKPPPKPKLTSWEDFCEERGFNPETGKYTWQEDFDKIEEQLKDENRFQEYRKRALKR